MLDKANLAKMSRIHPAEVNKSTILEESQRSQLQREGRRPLGGGGGGVVLTVWKRSSMSFQGTDGFTVFDSKGRLVYRVDNYSRKHRYVGLVLMDGVGNPLLTLKPQMLSMQCQWHAYKGENNPKAKVFSMRNPSVLNLKTAGKDEAVVLMGESQSQTPDFRIEGSFRARDCKIKTTNGRVAAKIIRKRVTNTILLSDDVFSLVVEPGFDPHIVMGFIVVLDRICNKPYTPLMCN